MNDFIIICDEKNYSQKNKLLWIERTGGKLEGLKSSNIYKILKDNPIFFVENHNSEKTKELIKKFGINCLLNAGTPRKISEDLINVVDYGILNVHPGVLPKYRGCSSVEWSLYNNDPIGNTVHFMDSDYDTGPIIYVEIYKILKNQSYQDIRNMIYLKGCKLLSKTISKIKNYKMNKNLYKKQNIKDGKYWSPIPQYKFKKILNKYK